MIVPQRKIRKFLSGGLADSLYFTPVQTYLPKQSTLLDPSLFQAPVAKAVELPKLDKDLFKDGYQNEVHSALNQYNQLYNELDKMDPKDIRYGNREFKLKYNTLLTLGQELNAKLKANKDSFELTKKQVRDSGGHGEEFSMNGWTAVKDNKTGQIAKVTELAARKGIRAGQFSKLTGGDYFKEREENQNLAFNDTLGGELGNLVGDTKHLEEVNKMLPQLGSESYNTISKRIATMNDAELGRIKMNITQGQRVETNDKQLDQLINQAYVNLSPGVQNLLRRKAQQTVSEYKQTLVGKGKDAHYEIQKDSNGQPIEKSEQEYANDLSQEAERFARRYLATKLHIETETPQDAQYSEANNAPTEKVNDAELALIYNQGNYQPVKETIGSIGDANLTGTESISKGYVIPLNDVEPLNADGTAKIGEQNPYIRNFAKSFGVMNNGQRFAQYGSAADNAVMNKNAVVIAMTPYVRDQQTGELIPVSAANTREVASINEEHKKKKDDFLSKHPDANPKEQQDFDKTFYESKGFTAQATVLSEITTGITQEDLDQSQKIFFGKGLNDVKVSPQIFKELRKDSPEWKNYVVTLYKSKLNVGDKTSKSVAEILKSPEVEDWLQHHKVVTTVIKNPIPESSPALNKFGAVLKEGRVNAPKVVKDASQNYTYNEAGGTIPTQVKAFTLKLTPLSLNDLH